MAEQPRFPNFPGKHEHESMITPQDFLKFWRGRGGRLPEELPDGVILNYSPSLLRHVLDTEEVEDLPGPAGTLHLLRRTRGRVAVVGGFGIGAPAAAVVLEELIVMGIRRFLSIGAAGGLQRDLRIGDTVLCERAIRDEGVSHHYAAPATYSHPSPDLTRRLGEALQAAGITYRPGTTWTIDAPYRETVAEARHYQESGVLTVEMEASALFAVAEHRRVEIASAFVISDSLAELVWDPQFGVEPVRAGLERLLDASVTALCGLRPPAALS